MSLATVPPIQHIDLIICDLEATCWNSVDTRHQMETIEIGAVRIRNRVMSDEFSRFIRPVANPQLSDFCKSLTSINQKDVDSAELFPQVFQQFLDWIGTTPFFFCSWGRYDLSQLQLDTNRHAFPWPVSLDQHLNLKRLFAEWRQIKSCGMERALQFMKLSLEGTHHRGIDDARNIARLTLMMLPWLILTNPKLLPISMDSPLQ